MQPKLLRRSLLFTMGAIILLSACQPAGDADLDAMPPPTLGRPVEHVLILSIDGLRPEVISQARMPNLMALMQEGAYTLTAQTISPSSTLPAHTSMLTGLCPAEHGVTWNKYRPNRGYADGTDLFDLAHAADLETAMFVGKEKLRQITEPTSSDVFEYVDGGDSLILAQALGQIREDFGVLFVHFPSGDWAGHEYGWLSDEQLETFHQADDALHQLLTALEESGVRSETLVIVTADHGGHRKRHSTRRAEDMTIPWIITGPGVLPMQLKTAVHTTDTAATAAWALGLRLPAEWTGRPVTEAFGLPVRERPEVVCP